MSYLYLASPYTDADAYVREGRYLQALDALHWLLNNHIWTYSPIVHCHEAAKLHDGLPKDFEFWREFNHLMIQNSRALAILQISGWNESKGIADEVGYATALNLPISRIVKEGQNYAFYPLRTARSSNP
jgi:hypothetical protein